MSYVYHAMSAYFDRDNVALPGLASYFRAASLEERGHATELMDFQVHILCFSICSIKCSRQTVSCKHRCEGHLTAVALNGLCEKGCNGMNWRRLHLLIADASSLLTHCIITILIKTKCFPACDEVGTCRTSLVSTTPTWPKSW